MTRASLLHILDHVGSISEAEVRELEQLATAFPYCQTAHVLLAKAAHDRGSMLASQRLRRAATYAADRQLLRQLLEQPTPALLSAEAAPVADVVVEDTKQSAPSSAGFFEVLVTEDAQPLEAEGTEEESVSSTVSPSATPAPLPDAVNVEAAQAAESADPPSLKDVAPEASAELVAPSIAEAEAPTPTPENSAAPEAAPITAGLEKAAAPEVPTADALEPEELAESEASEPEPAAAEPAETSAPPAAPTPESTEPAATTDDLLPAVAPPIRPPTEAGISRFEFGLGAAAEPAETVLYQLPSFDDSDDEAFDDELLPLPSTRSVAPFQADALLAYALLGGGSRYGYALQAQDAELTTPLPQTEFFPPDALLTAHAAPAPVAALPSSLDLINRFLKNQPRLKSPAVVPPAAVEEQADLSVRSTSVVPALASESLARIMVKQGKVDKAIEIYERLMVRQPEKSAYFADQIQQLQNPE